MWWGGLFQTANASLYPLLLHYLLNMLHKQTCLSYDAIKVLFSWIGSCTRNALLEFILHSYCKQNKYSLEASIPSRGMYRIQCCFKVETTLYHKLHTFWLAYGVKYTYMKSRKWILWGCKVAFVFHSPPLQWMTLVQVTGDSSLIFLELWLHISSTLDELFQLRILSWVFSQFVFALPSRFFSCSTHNK